MDGGRTVRIPEDRLRELGRRWAVDVSWSRVTLVVGLIVAVGGVALQMYGEASLNPKEPYGSGTVTIAGQTHEAEVCESVENGVELTYGFRGEVLYVRHMGPSEIYEGQDVTPARTDGTFFVRRTGEGEQWSRPASLVERTSDGVTFGATFDGEGGPVTVTVGLDPGGWCDGADPNVWWR